MALGTAFLLLHASHGPPGALAPRGQVSAAFAWCGRLSYELYLFHLVVLGLIRTMFPDQQAVGDEKLVLLAAFLALSAALAAIIAKTFSEPLNRFLRSSPVMARVTATT